MSFNGSGQFNINSAGQPVVTGTTISSTAFNALTADLATGLSTALCKDGQSSTTARIPFASGIGLSNGTVAAPAVNFTNDTGCGFYRIGSADIGFAIGGTKVWDVIAGSITLSHDLLFTDATYDIGKTGATRPRDIFASRNLTIGGTTAIIGHVTVEGVTSTGATGTGKFVFDTSPTLVTPVLGVASGTRLGLGVSADAANILQGPNGSILNSNGAIVNAFAGPHAIGGSANLNNQLLLTGTFTGNTTSAGLGVSSTINGNPNNDVLGISNLTTLVEAASGMHAILAFYDLVGAITPGAATTNDAIGLNIRTFAAASGTTNSSGIKIAAPTGATNNYAINIASGTINIAAGGSTTISTGVGSVKLSTANSATNTAWIPISYSGTTYFVPAWTTNAP